MKNGGSAMREHLVTSIRLVLAMTVLLGLGYPVIVWGAARLVAPKASSGAFESAGGRVVGSSLIGQKFAAVGHFRSRPSAAGDAGYDAKSSGGSNLAPTSKKLADSIKAAVEAVRKDDPAPGPVPADAVTSSASGLDPHISPEYALRQVPRIATATGVPKSWLKDMVARRTEGRFVGLFGEPRVNVLLLNLDVDRAVAMIKPAPASASSSGLRP
jgi:potassium-transporting ATPase KdpC subunit